MEPRSRCEHIRCIAVVLHAFYNVCVRTCLRLWIDIYVCCVRAWMRVYIDKYTYTIYIRACVRWVVREPLYLFHHSILLQVVRTTSSIQEENIIYHGSPACVFEANITTPIAVFFFGQLFFPRFVNEFESRLKCDPAISQFLFLEFNEELRFSHIKRTSHIS